MLFKLNELKKFRRTVGSVAGSCLAAAGPLLASVEDAARLIVLNIVEDGIAALEVVEKSYMHEKQAEEEIGQVVQLFSLHGLKDILDSSNEGVDENRLLPAMNKLWPYMVVCLKHGKPVAVKRCLRTVSIVVQVCGGDFFIRRFRSDGSFLWKLLTPKTADSRRSSKNEGPILLPYRKSEFRSTDESTAEVSILKVQEAALHMISDIAQDKRSASALEGILKKVSGLVVGIACGGPDALQDAAVSALSSLSCIDPDLIWVLLADIVYSSGRGVPSPPTSDFPEVSQLLPSPSSPKEYLCMQYCGEDSSFDIQLLKAENVFEKLNSEVFTFQATCS
ncbi:hypothetical protein EJ110_NYTH29201 [Nymphaea thermarum]|nr:hypothetical protein EJ110_NYTH29201 [Nymphaea thermarum]